MATIGETLRIARQQRGISLEDAEQHLHIQKDYLSALEANLYDVIPGSVYTKGFLRNYGNFLGLSGDELVLRYKEQMGEPKGVPNRRLKTARIQAVREEVKKGQEVIDVSSQRLSYRGRQQRRQQTIMRERIIGMILLIGIILFMVWLLFF